jgi:methylmalonyl-CoA mutase N-terminal domain/subunit
VNDFVMSDEPPIDILLIDESVAERQIKQLQQLRQSRDNGHVRTTLENLRRDAAANNVNMMPTILDCVRSYCTLGEICDVLRDVYGLYEEPAF